MSDQQRPLQSIPFLQTDRSATPTARQPTTPAPSGPGSHLLAAAAKAPIEMLPPPAVEAPAIDLAPTPAPAQQAHRPTVAIDWTAVAQLRSEVAKLLSQSIEARPGMTEEEERAVAEVHTRDSIDRYVDQVVRAVGDSKSWTAVERAAVQKAVLDSLYGLGRLQPLVELEGVENIDITGFDHVFIHYADGRTVPGPSVANSDAELMQEIQFLASRGGESGRSFTAANPILDMDLPGGARLAAVAPPVAQRIKIVIRVHRYVDISLEDMVFQQGTLTVNAAKLLKAAVLAGLSIVTSGAPGSGKTTLTRALCGCIDPLEPIVTIEKERELYLDRMGDRHLIVTALQYRRGTGERAADGTQPGEVTLVELLEEALRLNAQRIVVGEVRGGEIDAMFQAMQAGVGSFSTLHANSASEAIDRMTTLTTKNLGASDTYAYRQIAQHIDMIVQISITRDSQGIRRRRVTEIAEVVPGEEGRPIAKTIFRLDQTTEQLVFEERPTTKTLEALVYQGLDPAIFQGVE